MVRKKPHFIYKWLCYLFFAIQIHSYAQITTKAFEKYGVTEGIPEEWVSDLIQDEQGFIWFTTQNGLVKYDGYNFKVFKSDGTKNPDQIHFISTIGGLIKARDGKIWIGTFGETPGLVSFDPKSEKFKNYYPERQGMQRSLGDFLDVQLEDSSGNIWFTYTITATEETYYYRFDPKTNKITNYALKAIGWNADGRIVESSDAIWILDDKNNINKWNSNNDRFETVFASGKPLDSNLPSDTIKKLIIGKPDCLLLTSDNALYIFDTKTTTIKNYRRSRNDDKSLADAKILDALEDKKGQYWVMHEEGMISIIDPVTSKITTLKSGVGPLSTQIPSTPIHTFLAELQNDQGIWFTAVGKNSTPLYFMYYDFRKAGFEFADRKFNVADNPIQAYRSFKFMEDRTGLLWLYTRPNLYKESPKSRQMDLFRHTTKDVMSIPSDTITRLFEDSKKRLWVGTINGLARYIPETRNFRIFLHSDNISSLGDNRISSIIEDADGSIWVVTTYGINKFDESTGSFKRYFYNANDPNQCIFLKPDSKGRLWLSIYDKGVFILDRKNASVIKQFLPDKSNFNSLTSQRIMIFYEGSDGVIWLGDAGNHDDKGNEKFGLYRLNPHENDFTRYLPTEDPNSISSYQLKFITEDNDKRIWIGFDEGMNMFDATTNRFKLYDDGNMVAFTNSITDKNKNIWFTCYGGGGLVSIDTKSGTISAYGEAQGLLNNDLHAIAMDDSGMFWIPNQRGLSVFDPNSKKYIKNYFTTDGFQPNSKWHQALKSSNGDIWIGGLHGLSRVVPGDLLKKDTTLPSIVITQIAINDSTYSKPDGTIFKQSVAYSTEFEVEYWQKDISFDFVALHYLRSEDNLYSWMLENYDEDWTTPSHDRKASYTNLSPGTYTFKVKASNADGVWNESPKTIKITILPPWWRNWWAYLGYFFGLLGTTIGYSFLRAEKLRNKNKKLEEKVAARTSELQVKTLDLQNSIVELKATQSQLIQSEKMASLGELTAGIAHEIQNPLNFVNNFSEINKELLIELKEEINNGNLDDVKQLADDVLDNEEKINHHGKRADAIVKGMLQHSRTSSGVKEATDINALADEYLRLAYHGLRAKDKSFNATMKTDFDESIGKVKVVPQDIGRVILNLITNAFHAVDEKKKEPSGFIPVVSVTTRKTGGSIEIMIQDNGNGIPSQHIDKIFQPFFTTKPTGQGTGLGLSLSYDIVKAHGGQLNVETKEGVGTMFTVCLPIQLT